ncbi:NAD(P)-dependent oxidoreductase [Bradyrhizobium sp. CB82]|uniref:NAD-dependent epimerase/dehydratase family protein n=1 Tax=Bradyrhizobium sp. CB82 TaxID=3039159 RepID=UPI0024B1C074|nr:NAD(P)-dependent oxidoreductase [Bradyrhizobium sp. CB82]WFU41524.1 NAD(P)-dependent oxidoreductase [Bradyrhizobium sp. CB82]
MNVLILGGGLVGCETLKQLRIAGIDPVLADLAPDHTSIESAVGSRCEVERVDIGDRTQLAAVVKKHQIDSVVNSAAVLTKRADLSPLAAVQTNVGGVANLLEMLRLGDLRRIVSASSTTVTYSLFDRPLEAPIPEDFLMRVVSQHPGSIYATTKLMGEMLGLAYRDRYSVEAIFLRLGAVIGRWPSGPNSIPSRLFEVFRLAIDQKTTAVVDDDPLIVWSGIEEFVDVRDAARANVCALLSDRPLQAVYNIANGEAISIDDVIAAFREFHPELSVELRATANGALAGFEYRRPAPSDLQMAQRELGFVPMFTLRDSVKAYLDG